MKAITTIVIAGFMLLNTTSALAITGAAPLNVDNVKAFYTEVTSDPPNITNSQYGLLPVCINPPTNCPDINGEGGDSTTCPEYCTVTRTPESLPVYTGTTRVQATNVVSPVCPASYVALNTYNMQNEAVYNTNPTPIQPIPGMTLYSSYKTAGYSCAIYGTTTTSDRYCSSAYEVSEIVDTISNANNKVVYISEKNGDGCYCDAFGCNATCDCSISGTKKRWKYKFYFMQCTPPPGLYLTGNLAPASVVCARAKTKWNALTPPPTTPPTPTE